MVVLVLNPNAGGSEEVDINSIIDRLLEGKSRSPYLTKENPLLYFLTI
jgi:hypothetical protein